MTQLFSPHADSWLRVAFAAVVGVSVAVVTVMLLLARSPLVTGQHLTPSQPVAFSHQHHVADAGIDCRYCHASVETSSTAGMPTTAVCMNCHRELWTQAEILEPVRASFRDDRPLAWTRVHDLPDYVYFNHSVHIHRGIGCYSCHGDVGQMPLIRQAEPLTMQWCLACHRDPAPHIRPHEFVFIPKPLDEIKVARHASITQPTSDVASGVASGVRLDTRRLQDCYTCHR